MGLLSKIGGFLKKTHVTPFKKAHTVPAAAMKKSHTAPLAAARSATAPKSDLTVSDSDPTTPAAPSKTLSKAKSLANPLSLHKRAFKSMSRSLGGK